MMEFCLGFLWCLCGALALPDYHRWREATYGPITTMLSYGLTIFGLGLFGPIALLLSAFFPHKGK